MYCPDCGDEMETSGFREDEDYEYKKLRCPNCGPWIVKYHKEEGYSVISNKCQIYEDERVP